MHISEIFLQRLPENLRKDVLDAAVEAGTWWNEANLAEKEQLAAREWLIKEKGIVYTYPNIAEIKAKINVVALQDRLTQTHGPEAVDLLKRVRETTANVK